MTGLMMHNATIGRVVTDLQQVHLGGSANQTVCGWNECDCMDALAAKAVTRSRAECRKVTQQWNAVRGIARGVHEDQHSGAYQHPTPRVGHKINEHKPIAAHNVAMLRDVKARGLCEDLPILLIDLFLHLLVLGRLGNASRHMTWWFCGAFLAAHF